MNRNKALALNSMASLLQQIVALICGLIVPRLILSTFGSAANGTVASISQFISITSLIQGGVTGATRVAFYGPIATGDMKKASVVYKTSQSFYTEICIGAYWLCCSFGCGISEVCGNTVRLYRRSFASFSFGNECNL